LRASSPCHLTSASTCLKRCAAAGETWCSTLLPATVCSTHWQSL
jgi:hypothetical protein